MVVEAVPLFILIEVVQHTGSSTWKFFKDTHTVCSGSIACMVDKDIDLAINLLNASRKYFFL